MLDSSSISPQSATVIIPVPAPMVKADVPSESVSSLPPVIDQARFVVSPVVVIVPTAAEQDVDSA